MACQSVRAFLSKYQLTHDVADSTIQQYGYAVTALRRFAGRDVTLCDLSDHLLNRWIEHRRQANIRGEWGHARQTIRNQAAAIKTLWTAAFEAGLVRTRPQRVKQLKVPLPIPEAYDLGQFGQLVAACDQIDGQFPFEVPRSKLLRALVLTAYYSGLRPCDVLALRRGEIRKGLLVVRQQKTGEPIYCQLPADVLDAIAAMGRTKDDRLFPLKRKTLRYWFLKLLAIAKLRGTPKWIRRTGATQVELNHPGAAQAFLGHRTPGLAWRHYIDRRQLQQRRPLPPPLAS